jgi:hypothetical protein
MFHENWYSESQLSNLVELYKGVSDLSGSIIEIGCWEGKSTVRLANECYPKVLICNDTWLGNVEESKLTGIVHPTEMILKERDVFGIFKNNMDSLTKGNYLVIREDCIKWLTSFTGKIKF